MPCTFNGNDALVSGVTPGEMIAVSCSGFSPNEEVALDEVSPLFFAVDQAQSLNEIDPNAQEVTADSLGDVNVNYEVPDPFTAPDAQAVCPPSQLQMNSGLYPCLLVVADEAGNGSAAALTYANELQPQPAGYWEVASDGGLFAFNTGFEGSMGGKKLAKPIVGMAYDPDTGGYWEVAPDGGIFAFGGARSRGPWGASL